MAKTVTPDQLAAAIREELTLYHTEATTRVNAAGLATMKKLVKRTKATAPVGHRGSFRNSITYEKEKAGNGMMRYVWGAKAPDYRLTHLLVHGHAAKDGGRVPGNSFLQDALDALRPEYENAIKEALQE